ncbi:MAG TPA: hypothetical protein DDW52_25440 [Planctomycetaceae bacterium]|nr:hypothetical protein [Planctomycetaceae bacterium]
MIPAVLSCVFVFYLYRTLNAPASEADSAGESSPSSESNLDGLKKDLENLRSRLEGLSVQNKGGNQ